MRTGRKPVNCLFLRWLSPLFICLLGIGCGGGGEEPTPGPVGSKIQGKVTASSNITFKAGLAAFQAATNTVGASGATCGLEGTDKSATTDQNGFFTIDDVPSGSYILICKKTASDGKVYAFLKAVEVQGGQTVDLGALEITQTGSIQGKSTLADQTEHMGITVFIPGTSIKAATDALGAYLITDVPESTYELRFEKEGYKTVSLKGVTVAEGKITSIGHLTLSPSTGATGNLTIENGAELSASLTVSVSITASSDAVLMQVSEDPNFIGSDWTPISALITWTFSSDGEKRLYIKFADAKDLESAPVSDSIVIDTAPPKFLNFSTSQTGTGANFLLETNEPTSFVIDYGLTENYGLTIADNSLATTHSISIADLLSGTHYNYRACATDLAGHLTCKVDWICVGGNTVSGTVTYQKKLYDENGLKDPGTFPFLPVRFAAVEVRGPAGLLATTGTNDRGRYCAAYMKTGEPTVNLVTVVAENIPNFNIQVGFFHGTQSLNDNDPVTFQFARYEFSKPFQEIQGEGAYSVDLDLVAGGPGSGSNPGGPFNIMDTLARGNAFFKAMTGVSPPLVTAIWQQEIGGTFFVKRSECEQELSISSDCIFVRGDGEIFFGEPVGGDSDEFDDDVLLHQYGHFLLHNFSKDSSPGGVGFLTDHDQDIRLSWSEGWAIFFSSAVRNNPISVDVNIAGPANLSFNIESNSLLFPPATPGILEDSAIYTTNEIAVASVLWDVFDDSGNEPFDHLSLGFGPIWDILVRWHETAPQYVTMETFWEDFVLARPDLLQQMLDLTAESRMEFFVDACEVSNFCNLSVITKENDNTLDNATPIVIGTATQHYTLFPAGDIDYISFQAQAGASYTIETAQLKNGADTYLEIVYKNLGGQEKPLLNAQGIPYADDNPGNQIFGEGCAQFTQGQDGHLTSACPNNETTFASKVVITNFTPPADCPVPCTLYARVSRSPNAPPSTGRFGSYDFRITQVNP